MKYTNNHNVAPIFCRAVVNDDYSREGADYTASDLVRPPQMLALERCHEADIVRDVSDDFAIFRGKGLHRELERHADPNSLVEERLIVEVGHVKIGGKPDGYEVIDGVHIVYDLKSTSVWSFVYGDKPEWERQLNIYAYLWREHGFQVDKLLIHAALYDWNRNEAKRNPDYPQTPFHTVEVPLWTQEAQEQYINKRLDLHEGAKEVEVIGLSLHFPCSNEDRWKKPTTYAVMKGNNKRATKVCDTQEQAETFIRCHKDGAKMKVEVRQGFAMRCENYCDAQPFCHQYKNEGKAMKPETADVAF
jgi:hypothetical protein